LDEFIIMPNHVHGIIVIVNVGVRFIVPNKSGFLKANPYGLNNAIAMRQITLGKIIRTFKAKAT